MAYTRQDSSAIDDDSARPQRRERDEPVSSLERVRIAEIQAQREAEKEAAAFVKDLFGRCFNTLDKGIEMAAKADLIRMVKD